VTRLGFCYCAQFHFFRLPWSICSVVHQCFLAVGEEGGGGGLAVFSIGTCAAVMVATFF